MSRQSIGIRRWHVLDDGILAYGLALLRTLWLWPLLHLAALGVFPDGREFLAPWMIFGVLAGGTLAAQVAARGGSESGLASVNTSAARARLASRAGSKAAVAAAICGLAVIVATVYLALGHGGALLSPTQLQAALVQDPGRALATLLLAAWLWWWGLRAGRETVTYDTLVRNFFSGLVGLLFVLGLNAATEVMARTALLSLVLFYLAVGLFLLALASIQATRRFERRAGEQDLALPGHWWATVGAVVAILLVAALVLSWLFVPETLGRLAATVALVLTFVGQAVVWLILVISYPVIMLLAWLASLITLRPLQGQLPELMPPPGPAEALGGLTDQGSTAIDPTVWWMVAGVLAIAAIVVVFVLAIRRYQTVAEDDVAETHEGILSVDLLKAQLAALLRRRRRSTAAPPPYLVLSGDDAGTQVRRTYQLLLQWAAGHGHVRTPGMTPDRYRDLLATAYPEHATDFAAINAAYTVARYCPTHILEADAERAAVAWQQISASVQTTAVDAHTLRA